MSEKYVRDMSGAELCAHMRRLQAMPGWHDPLSDSLYAHILALEAERDALRKSVEWVAVSEKEPPLGVTVLLAAEFDGPGDWRVKCGGLTRDRKWHVFGADWTPTYWKPLPTPPSIAIAAKESK